jgi:drug/metabolite transporter (DMT)-like permease
VTAVALACLSALLFGSMMIAMRGAGRRRPSAGLGALAMVIAGLMIALPVAILRGGSGGPVTFEALWPLLLSGALVPGLSHILFVQAVNDAGPSRAAIVISTAPLLSVALALILLGERFEPVAAIGAGLIVGGSALLAWERDRPPDFRAVGMLLAALTALLFALRDNLVRFTTQGPELDYAISTVVILASALPVIAVYLALTSRPSAVEIGGSLRAYLPAGAFFGAGYVALVAAFHHGRVAIVAPLTSTQTLWVIGLSALLLGGAERLGGRVLGAGVLVVVGAAVVGASR